ncbi:MAG: ABC transporter substrate-binding protein [Calothrix sp. C42_A2020_038]|nr:ABC transporter substrate-binding protein [Calothrix sp. C42_A2020_038]
MLNPKITTFIITLLLSLNVLSCSNNGNTISNNPKVNTIDTNITQPTQQVKRIVALTSLASDLIYNLDKTKLVGVPNSRYTDTIAKEKFADFPKVGNNTAINLEKIVSLKPDLVVGAGAFHDKYLAKLQELGIKTVVYNTRSWQDLENQTKDIAQRIGTDPKPIIDRLQSNLSNIPSNNKSVLVLVSVQPTSSPNKNSWAGDLLQKFNYNNIAADFESTGRFKGYLTLSQEKILASNPDKIFITETSRTKPEEFKKLPFWNKLRAVQNNHVYTFHHDGLVSPTSIDTVEQVTKQLREIATK